MSRVQKPEGAFVGANYVTVGPNEKDNYKRVALRGAKETKGQLRLVRTGKKLIYQIADGAGAFLVLANQEFSADDVSAVRVQASTGWQVKSGVDVRFINLEMRAEQMPKPAPRQFAQSVDFQLREGIEKQPRLRLVGPDAAAMANTAPQGLRFLVPAGRDDHKDVGVESQMRLRGDFEITLQYELLALPDPPPELATGAVLEIQLDTPDLFKARMGHTRRTDGAQYGANYLITGKDGKEEFKSLRVHPANEQQKRGSMRLARTGKVLSYQISAGPAGFLTFATRDIETADVISARALCNTAGRRDLGVDIRFISLELRADKILDKASPPPVAAADGPDTPEIDSQAAPSRIWLVVSLIVGVALTVLLAVTAGLWLFLRQGRRAQEIPGQGHEARTATVSSLVVFPCPDCDKKIKVKASSAGKKVKCPKCGQAVFVPATTQG
jgi:DNA-directed RNA polymerase subunit RPC12/RpoP